MLVKGVYKENQLFTNNGVFVIDLGFQESFKGIFEISNIRSEEVEREVDVDGRKMKVFVPKLKADIIAGYKEIDNLASESDEPNIISEDDDMQPSMELSCDEVAGVVENADEPSFKDKYVQNLNEQERLFGDKLRNINEFKIDPTADRQTIARQATLLNSNGFKFDAKTQTYSRGNAA